jgi:hypothetical protein
VEKTGGKKSRATVPLKGRENKIFKIAVYFYKIAPNGRLGRRQA